MEILYGISPAITYNDIDNLSKLGVTEFFLGITPPQWRNKYGWEISMNKRSSSKDNFWDFESAKKITKHIKSKGLKFFITLNDFMYTSEQVSDIKELMPCFEALNPDAYIIGDIALILLLEEWGISTPVNVSITAGCLNMHSVNFFKQFKNVKRIALPRYLSLTEIQEIRKNTNMELSCFAVTGGCEFGEEYCFTFHSDKREVFCNRNFSTKGKSQEGKTHEISKVKLRCGLCAIYCFNKIGINSVKFPSRGHSIDTFKELMLIKKACACSSIDDVKELKKDKEQCNGYANCAYNTREVEE